MRKFLFSILVVFGLVACGSNEPFDINESSDAAVSSDALADGSSGREDVKLPVSGTSCLNRCNDFNAKAACQCDDKCIAQGDCCGDFIKQCFVEVKPTPDAGSTSPDVQKNSCVDNDGDGYCDNAPKQGDCNDKDKNINPGMPEKCGDNVDNNCNGHVDEGCSAQCVPTNEVCGDSKDNDCDGQVDEGCTVPTPTGFNTLTVTYPEAGNRRLSYGISPDTSFDDWKPQSWTMSAALTVDLGHPVQSNCMYLRFNVDQPQGWLCMGNTTAVLNSQAVITANLFGQTYNNSNVKTVLKGGGCSALIVVAKPGATCPVP